MSKFSIYSSIGAFAVSFLAVGAVHSQPRQDWLNESVEIQKTLKDGVKLKIIVTPTQWAPGIYRRPQLWGAWGAKPETVIADINFSVNGESIYLPFSAYADLANVRSVIASIKEQNVVLAISGGEDGDAYRATLTFPRGKYLARRSVVDANSALGIRESTIYTKPLE